MSGPHHRKLWLWRNFVDGVREYWAFDNAYPCRLDSGDPLVLGEPCGYAVFIESAKGRVYDVLAARAGKVREALKLESLREAGFTSNAIDLVSTGQYPRAYAAGSIVSKTYAAGAIPSDGAATRDRGSVRQRSC